MQKHGRPIATTRRLTFQSAPHCPRCRGEFCDLIRTLDLNRDLRLQASSSLSVGAVVHAVEKSNERDRAYRVIRWVLSEEEGSKLDETGNLTRLRIVGKVDPFAYKTVPSKQIEAAKSEHRLGLAKLQVALADESTLMSEDEWGNLIKSHAEKHRQSGGTWHPNVTSGGERNVPTPSNNETLVCVVCYHVYSLLGRVRQMLDEGGENSTTGGGGCVSRKKDEIDANAASQGKAEAPSPPPLVQSTRTKHKKKRRDAASLSCCHENCKPNLKRSARTNTGSKIGSGASASSSASGRKQRKSLQVMVGKKRPRVLVADHDEVSFVGGCRQLLSSWYP